jgi:hypothetical protein
MIRDRYFLLIGIALVVIWLVFFPPTSRPVTAQGASYRYTVAGYGGTLSNSPGHTSMQNCEAARNETNQGYPTSLCRFTNGN